MKRLTILSSVVVLLIVGTGAALAQEGECTPDAAYVADVTVPDDTVFEPGESFEKVWRLENSGDCDWEEGYALTFIRGDQLGAPDSQPLEEAVAAGETVDIAVEMTAPDEEGTYTSYWRMADAEGTLFGAEIYVRIVVAAPTEEEAPPPVSAPPPGVGEVETLEDGAPVYVFRYTPGVSPGSPEFQEQKRQAVSTAAQEFVTLDPRPVLMMVIPLDEAGNEIEGELVFISGTDVPAIAILEAGAIVVPETGKAVLLLENWIGYIAQMDVNMPVHSQHVDVPPKEGETPGRAFVSLDPGHYLVVGYARAYEEGEAVKAKGEIHIDLDPGEIYVWAMSIAEHPTRLVIRSGLQRVPIVVKSPLPRTDTVGAGAATQIQRPAG